MAAMVQLEEFNIPSMVCLANPADQGDISDVAHGSEADQSQPADMK